MEEPRCCPENRPSLAERIKNIIEKYEKNVGPCCPVNSCVGGIKKNICTRNVSIPLTCRIAYKCLPRPSSACNPCERSVCSPRPTTSWNPCVPSSPTCLVCPSRPSSAFKSSCRQKKDSPNLCTSLDLPIVCPGPNLQRYLSSKGICPSLRGRLSLYENTKSIPCSPRSTSNESTIRPKPPTISRNGICRCNGLETGKTKFCKPISKICVCNKSERPSGFKCPATNLMTSCRFAGLPKYNCPVLPGSCMSNYGDSELGKGLHDRSWNSTADPPFSSKTLEREFTSRFVKVQICSCKSSGCVVQTPKIMDFNNCRC